ncbi:MAG: polyketide synthase dehydratase domain-containing protein [Acidobacteriia bacterium]|nr:polyketide synthase dehydratase domain-containing protein [Terriglobia bacterium]
MGLKQRLTGNVHQVLEETYRLELAMHEKTFVGQSDTLAQIQNKFYQELDTPPASTQQAAAATANPSVDSDALPAVTANLKTLLANELQMRESDIDEDVEFVDLGLDSISGVTWIRKINEKYHTSIEATKVYSYPTLAHLSRYVKQEAEKHGTLSSPSAPAAVEMPVTPGKIAASQPKVATTMAPKLAVEKLTSWRRRKAARFSSAPAPRVPHPAEPIAVIGMSGQFPQAKNLDEFWQNIAQGRNCITQVPPDRWDVNTYYQPGQIVAGKTNSQWAGSIEDYDRFDPLFFNISPTEADYMDPQQRLFLQACWHAIENAGYDARALSGRKCGIFAGCTTGEYAMLSLQHRLSAQGFTGNAMSILAGRISYFLDLQGPCLSIDTACSSSLVAIANACDSLISGGSDLALAGGVYVMAGPEMHIKTAQAGMLSSEGKCFTFDQRADGFVPGEGVGVVMLKRLADAQRDQDIIYGVIEGWGVNQDGKTNGITAPNPESQTRLEQEVYDKYQIDPASIQLVEAHGTGTKLGDPIEVEGLTKAFKKYTQNKEYCALGSVKSNIGHCATAAGVAGFIKLIQALQYKQLPPTINFERLNEHIDLKDSPFYVNQRLQEWKLNGGERRRAAINSLGFSGTNAHLVIGEYLPPAEIKPPVTVITQNTKIIVPLSARNPEQLKQKACDLRDFICKQMPAADLIEIAYTLQVGREAMEERVGFLVSSIEQLAEKLEAYAAGEQRIEDVYQGQVRRNKENISIISQDDDVKETIIDKWIAQKKLSKLLDLWVKGLELDWNKLYGEVKPRRISLPTYPFAKERYWIDTIADQAAAYSAAAAVLHPLLHRNTSDLSEQRYSSTFTGDEFFLADHRVKANGHGGQKVLPGAAYLEMARAAIAQMSPIQPEASILELRNTVWLKPMVVTEPKQVSIALSADDNDQVSYEIYSTENEQERIHCQGKAAFSRQPAPAKLDIEQLKGQMEQIKLEASGVYAMLATIGLNYGPAHQGIVAIYLGEKQVLAQLHMPAILEASRHEYVLHPSLVDSALQASIGLIVDVNHVPSKPIVPFALDSLRIISACTKEMVAWVRYSRGSKPGDRNVKLDIDLCDQQGNVCAEIHGFVSRELERGSKLAHEEAINHSGQDKSSTIEEIPSFDSAFYQKLIADVANRELSVDEAAELT